MSEPIPATKEPIEIEIKAGETYWWCKCGRSKSQPFCDGSHEGTGIEPMEYKARVTRMKWFCGCKATKMPPFCDGSHSDL